MSINHLPEDCLSLILDRFPLLHLLHLRLTCTFWSLVVTSILRSRKSLKLSLHLHPKHHRYQVDYYQNLTKSDLLHLNPFTASANFNALDILQSNLHPDLTKLLSSLLPSLTSLVISIDLHPSAFTRLTTILTEWPTLECLSIYGNHNPQLPGGLLQGRQSLQVFELISTKQNLKNLTLKLGHPFTDQHLAHLEKPILDQLEQLTIDQYDFCGFEILGILGSQCTSLTLEPVRTSSSAEEGWLSVADLESHQFPESLTHLQLHLSAESAFVYLTRKYLNLTSLDLTFPRLQLNCPQLSHLQYLTNLTSLTLNNFNLCVNINALTFDPRMSSLPRLTSVSFSNFGFLYGLLGNGRLLCQTLAVLFPNVEVLTLRSPVDYYLGAVEEGELVAFSKLKKYQIFLGNLYKESC